MKTYDLVLDNQAAEHFPGSDLETFTENTLIARVSLDEEAEIETRLRLSTLMQQGVTCGLIPSQFLCQGILFDFDGTFVTSETINVLASYAGLEEQVAKITGAAMRGELEFNAAFRERIALLKGLPTKTFTEVAAQLTLTAGLHEFLQLAQQWSYPVAIASGGFTQIIQAISREYPVVNIHANELEVADGLFTGRHLGNIVNEVEKEQFLLRFAQSIHTTAECICVCGDGYNDRLMLSAGGLAMGFQPKTRILDFLDLACFENYEVLGELLKRLARRN